jgi:hypothetical protein
MSLEIYVSKSLFPPFGLSSDFLQRFPLVNSSLSGAGLQSVHLLRNSGVTLYFVNTLHSYNCTFIFALIICTISHSASSFFSLHVPFIQKGCKSQSSVPSLISFKHMNLQSFPPFNHLAVELRATTVVESLLYICIELL